MSHKSIITFVVLCSALILCRSANAEGDPAIRELLSKSGVELALSRLPEALVAGSAEARRRGLRSEKFDRAFTEAAEKAYAPEAVTNRMEAVFRDVLDPDDVKILLRHYNSSLARRIAGLEAAAAKASPASKLTYVREVLTNPKVFQDRVALCLRLDEATRTTDLGVAVAMHTTLALHSALIKAGVIRNEENIDALKSRLQKGLPALQRQAARDYLASSLYAYRDLDTKELQLYLEFLQSPVGKKFVFTFVSALDAALTESAIIFGDELVKNLTSLPL